MTIRTIYHVNEKCRITDKGPEVIREYRLGEDYVSDDAFVFLMGPYTQSSFGFPIIGQQYDEYTEIFVDDIQAVRAGEDKEFDHAGYGENPTGTLFVWKVTVKFAPPEYTKLTEDNNDYEIFDVSIFGEGVDMDGRFDAEGHANVNTAGEFYEDRLPMQAPVVVVRLSVKTYSPPDVSLHRTVNNDTWWGAAAKKWLCRNVSGEYVHNATERYWKNTYEFACINHPYLNWQLWKASSGYYHRSQESGIDSGSRVRNINDDGSENVRPVLLNAAGGLLNGDGSPPQSQNDEQVWYQYFDIYQSAAFPNFPNPWG